MTMFRVTNICETSLKLWEATRNSKNYISEVTFNYFFFRFSKSTEN